MIGKAQVRLVQRSNMARKPSFYLVCHHVEHSELVVIGLCPTSSLSRAIVMFGRKCEDEARRCGGAP